MNPYQHHQRLLVEVEGTLERLRQRSVNEGLASATRGRRLSLLEQEVGQLALLVRALYVYQREQPGFDPERFAAIVAGIDRTDGVADGQARMPVAPPAAASRPVVRRVPPRRPRD